MTVAEVVMIPPLMEKVTALVVPAGVVTVRVTRPEALAEMTNVAVIWVVLAMITLLIETPRVPTITVAPAAKFVPVSVTFTLVPADPELGLIDVIVGAAGLIVKVTGAVGVPPAALTVTLAEPLALAEIENVAMI